MTYWDVAGAKRVPDARCAFERALAIDPIRAGPRALGQIRGRRTTAHLFQLASARRGVLSMTIARPAWPGRRGQVSLPNPHQNHPARASGRQSREILVACHAIDWLRAQR